MIRALRRLPADRRAATVIEYALIAGILGLGIVVSMSGVRDQLNIMFNKVSSGYENRN